MLSIESSNSQTRSRLELSNPIKKDISAKDSFCVCFSREMNTNTIFNLRALLLEEN